MDPSPPSPRVRFGAFELNLQSGELFKHSRKIRLQTQSFLILASLLERPGEVLTREELRQKLWSSDVFVDFEVGLNAAINRLRDVLDDSPEKPRFIETLPRRGYRFIAPLERAAEKRIPPHIGSLAVLPLENLTGDAAQEYFVDGMTDALITRLAQIRALRVISRTSAMRYLRTEKRLPEIARELNVDAVVEGTVTRSGDHVRVSVQLIHAPSDHHLWAQKYDRKLCDILDLQSEVAHSIAQELQVQVTSQEVARLTLQRTVQPAAYEAYLKGRFYWNRRTGEGLEKALQLFQQAIAADGSYAAAYAGIADCYNMLAYWGLLSPAEAYPAAKAAAREALTLEADLAEARAALAWSHFVYDWDWSVAAEELERALEFNPGYATTHQWWTHYHSYRCRHDEALKYVERTLELDPVSRVMHSNAAFVCFRAGQFDSGVNHAATALDLDPGFAPPHYWMGACLEQQNKFAEAIAAFEQAVRHSGNAPTMIAGLAHSYAVSGQPGEARALLAELHALSGRRYVSPYHVALIYAGLNDNVSALSWLEKGFAERSAWMVQLAADRRFSALRSAPPFHSLLRGIGLVD